MIMITCSKCKTLGLAAEGSKRCHDCAEKKRAKKRRKAAEAAEARAVGASGGLASETAGSGTGEKSHTPTPSTQQSQAVLTEGGQAAALLQKIEQDVTCTVCLDMVVYPVTLVGCGHTFCFLCMHNTVEKERQDRKSPACPTCRASIRYPPSALNVMVDEMVRTVIDAASPAQKKREMQERRSDLVEETKKLINASGRKGPWGSFKGLPTWDDDDQVFRCPACNWELTSTGRCESCHERWNIRAAREAARDAGDFQLALPGSDESRSGSEEGSDQDEAADSEEGSDGEEELEDEYDSQDSFIDDGEVERAARAGRRRQRSESVSSPAESSDGSSSGVGRGGRASSSRPGAARPGSGASSRRRLAAELDSSDEESERVASEREEGSGSDGDSGAEDSSEDPPRECVVGALVGRQRWRG